jgi:hypothetical protein
VEERMKRAPYFAIVLLILIGVSPLFGQSNQLMDAMLAQKEASFGASVYMILAAAKIIPEDATEEQALVALASRNSRLGSRSASSPITLGEVSHLIMSSLEMKGGLMYSIIPGPRYASRELSFLKIVTGNTSPWRRVSGEEVVRFLGRALELKEGNL